MRVSVYYTLFVWACYLMCLFSGKLLLSLAGVVVVLFHIAIGAA